MKEFALNSVDPTSQSGASISKSVADPAPTDEKKSYPTLRALRIQTEIDAISRALQQTGWNRKQAARILNISYRGLLYKIQQHRITRVPEEAAEPEKVITSLDGRNPV